MRIRAALIVLSRSVVMLILPILGMRVIVAAGILMMPGRHALPGNDRRRALDRDGQGEEQEREMAKKYSRHRRAL